MRTSRKTVLTQEILAACLKIPGGSPKYRTCLEMTALSLVRDLSVINRVPEKLSGLNANTISVLVSYWKRKRFKPKTLKNKLGILRAIIHAIGLNLSIPTNQELSIKSDYKFNAKIPQFISPIVFEDSVIKNAFWLQYLFGLKKQEALLFNLEMIEASEIVIARDISYNHKERSIPIVNAEQSSFLNNLILPNSFSKRGYSAIHADLLKSKNIMHPDYYRHYYILNRFIALGQNPKAIKQIALETGYARLVQVREILACLKSL